MNLPRVAIVAGLCVAASPAAEASAKEIAKAEHVRLSEEMNKHAGKLRWQGVERAYRSMEPLVKKGVVLTYRDHYQGAQAARELGNINQVFNRLQRAEAVEKTGDVANWLADINANYGLVELVIPKSWKGEVGLDIASMPLFPDQRSTIGLAQGRVSERKSYMGLLPVGEYTFADKSFTVVPGGDTIRLELGRKHGAEVSRRKEGERAPFRFTYVGPRADIGLGWTSAADARGGGAQPGGFGGAGTRLGGGLELGVGGAWGVVAQLGYHNLFGNPSDSDGALEDSDGFKARMDMMHMGYGWLAASYRLNDLWLALGPIYSLGSGGVTGVNGLCVDTPESSDCKSLGTSSSDTLRKSRMTGEVRAGGAALGASYAMWTVGPLEAALSLNLGVQSDMSRMYPWTAFAVTLGPAGPEDDG